MGVERVGMVKGRDETINKQTIKEISGVMRTVMKYVIERQNRELLCGG